MSVSRRTVGATLTGESATNPIAALAAAQVASVAADPMRILPVTGHDDAAAGTHAHTVSAESAAAFQGSGAAKAWVAQHAGAVEHTPIVSGHEHLLATAHTPSTDHATPAPTAAHVDDSEVNAALPNLPNPVTLGSFGHTLAGQSFTGTLGQHVQALIPTADPIEHHGSAPANTPSGTGGSELWISATSGADENLVIHSDDSGTHSATNVGTLFTPDSANNPSAADAIQGLDLLQLDSQDDDVVIASESSGQPSNIYIGNLANELTSPGNTPSYTKIFTDTSNGGAGFPITGLKLDVDNSEVYFVDKGSFEKMTYTGTGVTVLGSNAGGLTGLALDLPHHVAYFVHSNAHFTSTINGAPETTINDNGIYATSTLNTGSGAGSVTITELAAIPVADGIVTNGTPVDDIAVDTVTGMVYFTTQQVSYDPLSNGNHVLSQHGVYSYNPTNHAVTQLWNDTTTGDLGSIEVDDATGRFYVTARGTGAGIYDGALSGGGASLYETLPSYTNGGTPSANGFSIDNAPTFSSVTGTTAYALQGGSALNIVTSDGTDADTDNDKGDGAFITITNAQAGDLLEFSNAQSGTLDGGKVSYSYNSTTHVMTLHGTDSLAEYQTLLDSIQFKDTGTDATSGSHPTRTITVQTYDGLLASNVTGATTITLLIDRAPNAAAFAPTTVVQDATSSATSGTGLKSNGDLDADTLTISVFQNHSGTPGTFGSVLNGDYGQLTLNADGSYSYTANNDAALAAAANGSHPVDHFTFTLDDGHGGTTNGTLNFTIDRPATLGADSYSVVESNSVSGTSGTGGTGVLGNDTDKDGDSLTVTAVNGSGANVGSGTFQGTYGHLNLAANGALTYTADNTSAIDSAATGSHLTDSFTYTVNDGFTTTTQTVTFTLDRPATLGADNYNVLEGNSVSGTSGTAGTGVLGNDTDRDGDSLTVTAVNGSGANVGSGTFQGTYGHLNLAANGSLTYTADNTSAIDSAATGSHLTDSFTYTVSDGHGATTTQTATFVLDRAPTVVTQNETVAESGTSTGTNGTGGTGTLAGDSDRDGDSLLVTKLNGNNIGDSISAFAGTYGHLSLTSSGQYSYVADNTSAIDAAPTGSHPIDTFTVAVDDGHGGTTNETLNFSIDRAAIAQIDPITTTESSTVTASTRGTGLLGNDSDPDTGNNTGLSVTQVNGSAGNVGSQVNFADGSFITINADGTYTYDPNHAWDFLPAAASGAPSTGTETFTYQITGGAFVTDTITITGQDSNDTLQGSAGADTYNGGIGDDIFKMQDGGNDNVTGGVGDDRFYFGAVLTAADVVNGGTGTDTLILGGDYTGGNALVLSATSLTSVEEIDLHAGASYNITTNDANVGAGQTLSIAAASLGAGDVLTFNGAAETDGHFAFYAGAGNDVLTGGAQSDTFFLTTGGNDTAHGGGGNDTFNMGAAFTAADHIDGGTGNDLLTLNGDYSGGNAVVMGASTMTNIAQLRLTPGNSYDLTTNDANVAAGQTLGVNAATLGAGDTLHFNGSAETDGSFSFRDGAGNDVLTGGAQADVFNMGEGGNDHANGGGGNDVFNFDGMLTAADVINGGAGTDTLILAGDYSGGITFASNTIASVEKLVVVGGDSYNLILNGQDVAIESVLFVDGSNLTNGTDTLSFDGSAVTGGGVFRITGGAGGDTLIGGGNADNIDGGAGNDSITGGNGRDFLTGGTGSDTFNYAAPSESTGVNHDTITDLDFSTDHIHLAGYFVNAIDTAVTTGLAGPANFDANLTAAVGAGQLAAHDAVLFTADRGGYSGHTFLVIDLNGTAGYQSGADIVIDITGATNTGSFTLSTFS